MASEGNTGTQIVVRKDYTSNGDKEGELTENIMTMILNTMKSLGVGQIQ